ncbi:unnamed protein product [Larinioides sclopetarius]|uniref:Uncharacterized protein n=1 Tax=Larinioides sclopetarius TaxID=280406 RepID=A0AAV2BWP1_9ARAC
MLSVKSGSPKPSYLSLEDPEDELSTWRALEVTFPLHKRGKKIQTNPNPAFLRFNNASITKCCFIQQSQGQHAERWTRRTHAQRVLIQSGRLAGPMAAAYTMSKFASVGFSGSLRHELHLWGIRVISIEPEFFETDMSTGKNLSMRVEDAFVSADENVRKDYGEEFLRKFKTVIGRAYPPSPNMHKLLENIEKAVTLKNPDAVYKAYGNVLNEFILRFCEACPVECQVFIVNTYFRILGLPKPEKANKIYENYHCH